MGATLVEKLIAMGAGAGDVRANEIVSVSVDRLLINDYVGDLIFSTLADLGCKKLVAPEKVYLVLDHNMPSFSVAAADKLVRFKENAQRFGITHMTEVGRHGIGHQLMVENFVQPLEIALGTDSHATMYAGLGSFSCGITSSDAVSVLTTGKVWIKVPETLRIRVKGEIPKGVTAKDISLKLLRIFPEEEYIYKAVEIVGDTIENMTVEGRLVIANMMAEAGIKCAVFEADKKAFSFSGSPERNGLKSDKSAKFVLDAELDVSQMEPMVSCPNAVTNVYPISSVERKHVDQVFIGSCTNGRMEDLMQAAEILKGRKVAHGTRLLVTPASQQVALNAMKAGVMEVLMDAGATVLPSSCASCAGHGPGLIGKGECCVSTTNRNFKGRMGSTESYVYLGSAYTAAACAVTGEITDPRKFLEHKEGI